MNAQPLIHQGFISSLSVRFTSLCQIQVATVTQSSIGSPVRTWAPLLGHEAIPCAKGARGPNPSRAGGQTRTSQETLTRQVRYINLAGYFPEITDQMRAVVTDLKTLVSETLIILATEVDSQHTYTRLDCEIVTL